MGKFNYKGLMKPTDPRYKSNLLTIQITGWKRNPKKIDIEKVREALMGLAQSIREEKEKEKK